MNLWVVLSLSLVSWIHLVGSKAAVITPTMRNETDRLALLAFKNAIIGDPLHVFTSWNHSLHFCEWSGVTCSRRHHQRVTALSLTGCGLVGQISSSTANLSFLRAIDLSNNALNGRIPQEVGHLFRLRYLNLSYNSLGGEIPTSLINCSEIEAIDLNGNYNIQGIIPVQLGSLSKLRILNLGINNLTGGIPPFIGNLSSLTHLILSRNSLGGNIPDELGWLWNLNVLRVSLNQLSGEIPPSLYNLSSLTTLSVVGNQLRGILPWNLGLTLPNLQNLYMGLNEFTGPIPVSLANASSLMQLDLSNNSFSGPVPIYLGSLTDLMLLNVESNQLGSQGEKDDLGFINSLTNCSSLEVLSFGVNQLGGLLPGSIANFSTRLTELWFGSNEIYGSIPIGIDNLINLNVLTMARNHLAGHIPFSIGKLRNLEQLSLYSNNFSGEIPASLGNITYLSRLHLQDNNLHGSIPLSLGSWKHMEDLFLGENNLVGGIPKQFLLGLSSRLSYLNLSHNSFTGSLPAEVGSMKNLKGLDISENKLSGEIPTTLGDYHKLVELYMAGNFFQGGIPSSLRNLGGIEDLDLSFNNLSGHVPEYLGNFVFLQSLNLSFNNLEGELPKEGIFKNRSAVSVIGNKNLCGGIPTFHLPTCPDQSSKKGGKSIRLKVIIPVISSGLLLILLSCLYASICWIRKSREKSPSMSSLDDPHLKVSYKDLLKATDGFSLSNLIGVGSYGSVYKGVLDCYERIIAVKVLSLQQQGALKSFTAECNALRHIRHRNLVKILTACSSIDFQGNDFKALVFEYMPNGSLEKWLHPSVNGQHQLRNLNLVERLNLAIDVASALEYLHHHGHAPIVHRDLKPSNVLLDNDMTGRVSDFGLTKILPGINNNSNQSQSSSVAIKGSVGYVAPEYGLGGDASTQGDVYSYGILLLELFTGKRPTDDMFIDSLSLHQFAKMALPEQVMEITDPQLLLDDEAFNNIETRRAMRGRIQECLVSVIQIGVACSTESPRERMEMREVVREMQVIHDIFLGVGIHGERRNRARLLSEG
ncbi:putative receptor-like protein kinase At3g47110 [Magnolia sinica]|uniref:putative receptor-like protein kinase At3g47110 n=1 Tax=Magnolia sinica TaxID=86752 RepID=UPI002659BBEF|nr:putative receptor-like protein kinase At3g47110 [Magnolia sinica]